jgi:hypothetical protein
MDNKRIVMIGFIGIIIGVISIGFGYFFQYPEFLFTGVVIVVISGFTIMILQSINLFINDKKLDIDLLRKQGLTIVTCPYCEKGNVLEDKYCIYCGEELGEKDNANI